MLIEEVWSLKRCQPAGSLGDCEVCKSEEPLVSTRTESQFYNPEVHVCSDRTADSYLLLLFQKCLACVSSHTSDTQLITPGFTASFEKGNYSSYKSVEAG